MIFREGAAMIEPCAAVGPGPTFRGAIGKPDDASDSMDWMRVSREAFSTKRKEASASAVTHHFAVEAEAAATRDAAR